MKKTVLGILFVAMAVCGCASMDRIQCSKLVPIDSNEDSTLWTFIAVAATNYPLDSPNAERIRMQWLEKWLEDNDLDSHDYSILKRMSVLKQKNALGSMHDIYYTVRVPKGSPEN